jgi:two-component system phosphate regulon response regulator PhoB
MRPVIFVVDDDPAVVRLLRHTLEAEGFAVRAFSSAREVLGSAQEIRPSLFLLDMTLPDATGLDLCCEIRLAPVWAQVPVIFVTARDSEKDLVSGLQMADDYVIKPFRPVELVARVQAVLRRFNRNDSQARVTVGELELDSESMTVKASGQDVGVTALEFRLLAFLASNIGRAFRRDQLLDAVWDARFVTPRTIDVHIRRLREKIEPQPEAPRYLQTVRGKGYRLAPQSEAPISGPRADRVVTMLPTRLAM